MPAGDVSGYPSFCSEKRGHSTLYQQDCTGAFSPAMELIYSARAWRQSAPGYCWPCFTYRHSRLLHTVGMELYLQKWQKLPAQSALQLQRGLAKSQPPSPCLAFGSPALHQHLHVVYISMQIFRLWFVTLHMTPRCSVGKAKQGPGKGSKAPPGPSRTMTKLWDILSSNNGNSPGILP